MSALDTARSSIIMDHPYTPPISEFGATMWWERCAVCRLAESAHADTTVGHPFGSPFTEIQARRAAASE